MLIAPSTGENVTYDVVIVGGGPAGFAAALQLGRGRRRVLLCEAGPPRNAAAVHMHGFVTRDGTPPETFRAIAREQLAPYDTVELRQARVEHIDGERGRFRVATAAGEVLARRVLLTTGVIDLLPDTPGYRELWGKAIFQCPYCHGWEVRDRAFGFLAPSAAWLEWALLLQGWSRDLVVFTDGRFAVPPELRARLEGAGISIEERAVRALVPTPGGEALAAVELADGVRVAREVLFARPPQRQTDLVLRAELRLDDDGFVVVDGHAQTSRPGIYAAGDLTTKVHGAQVAAGAGAFAAYMLNHELAVSPGDPR